ncbi:MAG: RNase adapter RapZ [Thermodesulfobacteriota bacterium]
MEQILILSGLSGSGKSTAVKALEDIGFFCVDNLPPKLIKIFIDLCNSSLKNITKVAVVIDIRTPDKKMLNKFEKIVEDLRSSVDKINLLFLDCSDETIIKRYKETRRSHPLAHDGNLLEGIKMEKKILAAVKKLSGQIIDTSNYNVHQLKEIIQNIVGGENTVLFTTSLISFGYKYGFPYDADVIIDVRFLPSPHFDEKLKNFTGYDKEIVDFILSREDTSKFLKIFCQLLEFLLPKYQEEGKSYLTIAIGCTGGKHRSVVIVNELAKKFSSFSPQIRHRDINKL